jgi:hypothetical protein
METCYNDDEIVTKTNIMYNGKFKKFIKNIKINFPEDALKSHDLDDKMAIQNRIREFIVKNQNEIDTKNNNIIHAKSHRDFFCIFIALLIHDEKLDNFENLNEILQYIRKEQVFQMGGHSSNDVEDAGMSQTRFCCACNKDCSPERLYTIQNPDTHNCIIVGCECIKKSEIIEPIIRDETVKKLENDENYQKFKKNKANKNILILEEKLQENLNENRMSFKQNYKYIGTNFGENLEELKVELINESYPIDSVIEYIEDTREDKCKLCEKNNKDKYKKYIFKNNSHEYIALCKMCYSDLGYNNKKQCIDCGISHRNRKDNYCNECRLKSTCITCNDRKICKLYDKQFNRCDDCSQLNYCRDCKENVVESINCLCKKCLSLCKKCSCGKIIFDKQYKVCYSCHSKACDEASIKLCKKCSCGKVITNKKYNICYNCYMEKRSK